MEVKLKLESTSFSLGHLDCHILAIQVCMVEFCSQWERDLSIKNLGFFNLFICVMKLKEDV